MKKLIILDRDGVINFDSSDYIKSEAEWHPIPGSLEAIALLNQHGFKVVIASNQSGIARGLFDLITLQQIHQKMQTAILEAGGKIDKIYFCPHAPEDHCLCRKPKPGLYHQIEKAYDLDFKTSPTPSIGDSLRDLEAAEAAGCRPMLVLTGNGKKTAERLASARASDTGLKNSHQIPIYTNLYSVVIDLIGNT